MSEMPMHELSELKPPHVILAITEGFRASFEASLLPWARRTLRRVAKGDGHPVLVIPGFTASDLSTTAIRRYVDRWGYVSQPWNLGRNFGPFEHTEAQLHDRVRKICEEHGRKLSLVGWSLGGIYAREVAKVLPDHVRQVVTLGSPFRGAGFGTNVTWLYERMSGDRVRYRGLEFYFRLMNPPDVPCTSIFSKSDGVVNWQTCLEPPMDMTENIEVNSSHCGMGFNPIVLYAIADRLGQAEGAWGPFDCSGWRSFFYKQYSSETAPGPRVAAKAASETR